jgi:hypothetical protein
LIRVHRAVIATQKAAQNRFKKRLGTTTTHHAVGSRHRDDAAQWNEALCSLFSSVFFKVQQTVQTTTFYLGQPSVLNSTARQFQASAMLFVQGRVPPFTGVGHGHTSTEAA